MDTREQHRAQLVPALARITRSRDFRNSLAHVVSPENSLTLIPALPDDTMGYVFRRLADGGGRGVLAMPTEDGYTVALMWPASAARVEVAREDDHVAHIHANSSVAIFFDYLDQVGSAVIEQVAAQILGDRELV